VSNRPNTLDSQYVADALRSAQLFQNERDYFGPDGQEERRAFECAMEYDGVSGRLEVHFFASWQDGELAPALFHLSAHCHPDGSVTPSVLLISGRVLNARRLSRESFQYLLEFAGNARAILGEPAYSDHLAHFHNDLAPAVLREIDMVRPSIAAHVASMFELPALGYLSAA
jgi:hypothetical protein